MKFLWRKWVKAMKNKLWFLSSESFKRKVKTKWFFAVNIILALVIACILNIDSIINAFGGDFDEKQKIYIVDNTNKTYELLKIQFDEYKSLLGQENNYEIKKTDKDYKDIYEDEKNENAWIIVINNDKDNVVSYKLISESFIETTDYREIYTVLTNTKQAIAMSESNIDPADLAKITLPAVIEREILDETKKGEEEMTQMIMTVVFPSIILPFFILSLLLVQMIGAEVNDEKTTRGMEIIISNVSPKTHFLAKMIASNGFIILQGILLIAYVLLGFAIRNFTGGSDVSSLVGTDVWSMIKEFLASDVGANIINLIPLVLLMMIITFVAYSLLAAVLASMTTNIEDFQQLQTPIMIISLVAYYLAIMAGMFDGSLFIKIFSFVPFISAILAPSLLVLGQMTVIEFVIAIIIMLVFVFILFKYGLKIYKVGILNYSSKGLWKKMFKALKNE